MAETHVLYCGSIIAQSEPKTEKLYALSSRRFKVNGKDAMGVSGQLRGYNDANLYVAYNTRDKVTPTQV